MATFKHISSKNADYGAAEQYLTFEHDEFTMKPTLDENGRLVPREDYRLATLNCGDEDFAVACMRSNLRYGKNQKREDVKSHHYIISFDPRDGTDNGLTVDKAQSLGEEFCKEHFPGPQAIVCGDIAYAMENKKKMKQLHAVLLITGIPLNIIQWVSIILWITTGIQWLFWGYILVAIPYAIFIIRFLSKRIVYICPQCHEIFKPHLKEFIFSNHSMTLRKLTCTSCGYHGFCVETYREEEKNNE